MKKLFLSLACLASANFGAQDLLAQEEPVQRSSHPRGFASGAPLPAMTAPGAKTHSGGTAIGATGSAASGGQGAQQATGGGVNLTGNTRIDARAQGTTAAAVGQQNAAGNRVGAIGGK